jgi:hypothetical protein
MSFLDKFRKTPAKRAATLQKLRKERIKVEGEARLAAAEQKERAAISKAKGTIHKGKGQFLAKLAKGYKSASKYATRASKAADASLFGTPDKGFSLTGGSMGGYSLGGGDLLGPNPYSKPKPKRRAKSKKSNNVTIVIKK